MESTTTTPDDCRSEDAEYLRHDAYVATVITGGTGLMRLFDIADKLDRYEAALREYAKRTNWGMSQTGGQCLWYPSQLGWELAEEALK